MGKHLIKIGFCIFLLVVLFLYTEAQTNTQVNPNGYNIFYYLNGKIASEGSMKGGNADGYWKTYYLTGILRSEGNRMNTLLDSTWVFYSETGDTSEIINYRIGKKSGYYYTYADIVEKNQVSRHYLASKELYLDDKREGPAYSYYPDGNIKQLLNYRNGKKQGIAKDFDRLGTVITLYEYHNDYMISREFINRTDSEGRKIGVWKTFYPDGKLKDEEYYRNGVLHGVTKIYSDRGNLINERSYQEGQLVEEGIQMKVEAIEVLAYYDDGVTLKTKGIYLDSIPIGMHIFYDINGKPQRALRYNEKGIVVAEGNVNEREQRTGEWKTYFENGNVRAKGSYANERQTGTWDFFYISGKQEQTGNFQNGVMVGEWRYYHPNGTLLREENYERGVANGMVTEYSDSASLIARGLYTEGQREGEWNLFVGDVHEEGRFVQGLKDGVWRTYFNTGKLYHRGNFVQGNPDGRHEFYYPDGTLKEEQYYVMGRRDKNWKKYSENGMLFLTITYKNDEEIRINGIRIEDIKR